MLVILLIFGFVESGGRENGLIFSEGIAVLTQNLGCFFSVLKVRFWTLCGCQNTLTASGESK